MLNIKYIKENPQIISNMLKSRGITDITIDQVLEADGLRIDLQQHTEQKQAQLNQISSNRSLTQEQISQAKALKQEIQQIKADYIKANENFQQLMSRLPNIIDLTVPHGANEQDNKVISTYTTSRNSHIPEYKDHITIAGKSLDAVAGAQLAGTKHSVFSGDLALLHRAITSWVLEENRAAGYQEIITPYMVNPEIPFYMGVLPKFEEDLFRLTNGQYLIPTGEAVITGILHGSTLNIDTPIKYTAFTPCFRSEAGAAGKNTTNLIRLHQFHKAEIIQITHPEQSEQAHEDLTSHAQMLLEKLELTYRKILLCTGDMGFHSYKTYDLEVHMPGMNTWLEISSCSNTHEFQSRRLQLRNKPLPHIINGSALPIERTIAAILENYQTQDGRVLVPTVLQKYTGKEYLSL